MSSSALFVQTTDLLITQTQQALVDWDAKRVDYEAKDQKVFWASSREKIVKTLTDLQNQRNTFISQDGENLQDMSIYATNGSLRDLSTPNFWIS